MALRTEGQRSKEMEKELAEQIRQNFPGQCRAELFSEHQLGMFQYVQDAITKYHGLANLKTVAVSHHLRVGKSSIKESKYHWNLVRTFFLVHRQLLSAVKGRRGIPLSGLFYEGHYPSS